MTDRDDSLHLTATELRLATFRLARRLRGIRATDTVSDAQLGVLSTLRMRGRRTISALAECERVTAPSMTNMINALEEQGLVVRIPDDQDRRRVHVEITDAGQDIIDRTKQRRDEVLIGVLDELGFTDEELATLREASILMRKAAEA